MTTKAEAIEAAARALCAWDWSDTIEQGKRGNDVREGVAVLDAALALPDAPAPAAGERERSLVRMGRAGT